MKEQEIISCIKNKTEKAAELFLQRYRPLIRYIVVSFIHNEPDIEECINDIAWKIFDKIDSYDSEKGSWNAWITAIARNTALNRSRSNKYHESISVSFNSEEDTQIPSNEPTPEELLIEKERQAMLARAVRELPEQEKIIFYRKYYYCQSTIQIASELGLTARSVEGKLYRIRKRLKDMLGGGSDD